MRFADERDGWAFGPDLWSTHDGGGHWTQVTVPGTSSTASVVDLATAAGMVHAALFDGAVKLADSPVDAEGWTLSATAVAFGAGPVPRAQLVIQGTGGWLIEVDRVVVGAARLSGGRWAPWTPPCSQSGGDAQLAAATPTDLFAVCNEGVYSSGPPVTRAYRSSDGGATFIQAAATVPATGSGAAAVASGAPRSAIVAAVGATGATVLLLTTDGGGSWNVVYSFGGQRMVSDLGFTSANQGVVIAGDGTAATLLMTFDGGLHWAPVALR